MKIAVFYHLSSFLTFQRKILSTLFTDLFGIYLLSYVNMLLMLFFILCSIPGNVF